MINFDINLIETIKSFHIFRNVFVMNDVERYQNY